PDHRPECRLIPSHPLFPCTTLFRSEEILRAVSLDVLLGEELDDGLGHRQPTRRVHRWCSFSGPRLWCHTAPTLQVRDSKRPGASDRKSTRLNSSHSQISYAVFCL